LTTFSVWSQAQEFQNIGQQPTEVVARKSLSAQPLGECRAITNGLEPVKQGSTSCRGSEYSLLCRQYLAVYTRLLSDRHGGSSTPARSAVTRLDSPESPPWRDETRAGRSQASNKARRDVLSPPVSLREQCSRVVHFSHSMPMMELVCKGHCLQKVLIR